MIRLNLLAEAAVGSRATRRRFPAPLAGGFGIVTVAVSAVAWEYRTLALEEAWLDTARAEARQTPARSRSAPPDAAASERDELTMRIAALEHDREGTATTMHLLAHIGRSVPDDVWLTLLNGENDAITIEGLSLSHGAVAEFLTNLESGGPFGRPVDLARSNLQPGGSDGRELIEFAIRARLANADDAGEPAVTNRTVAVNGGVRR